jgi:hypothetical protein
MARPENFSFPFSLYQGAGYRSERIDCVPIPEQSHCWRGMRWDGTSGTHFVARGALRLGCLPCGNRGGYIISQLADLCGVSHSLQGRHSHGPRCAMSLPRHVIDSGHTEGQGIEFKLTKSCRTGTGLEMHKDVRGAMDEVVQWPWTRSCSSP